MPAKCFSADPIYHPLIDILLPFRNQIA